MQAEIIAIGNEVLEGHIVNTNAAFISSLLSQEGYEIKYHKVLPDNINIIVQALEIAIKQSDIVIVTGGLGPTCDDVTKEAMAKLFKTPLVFRKDVAAMIKDKTKNKEIIQNQAMLPKESVILPNSIGTAVGVCLATKKGLIGFFPGVPSELKEMFVKHFMPLLKERMKVKKTQHERWLSFCLLPEIEINKVLKKASKEISIGLYPSFREVKLHIMAKDKKNLDKWVAFLQKKFKKNIFSLTGENIEEVVHKEFITKKKKLALAESCSGGALCKSFVMLPGASNFLLGSIVCYSNALKEKILRVDAHILKTKGAVSRETVYSMVKALFSITSCDYAVAISGIAGPSGGTKEKPIGTVWIAIGSKKSRLDTHKFYFHGERKAIIEYSVGYALGLLWQRIHFDKIS
jgi:nicotinamide-nucleotide amidase